MEIILKVMGMSAGVRAAKTTPAPSVAQVLLQEFLQLVLALQAGRLSGEAQARVQPCADSQRATLFLNLTLTFPPLLLFQLPLGILLVRSKGIVCQPSPTSFFCTYV